MYAERNEDKNHHPSENAEQPVRTMTSFGNIKIFDHDVASIAWRTCALKGALLKYIAGDGDRLSDLVATISKLRHRPTFAARGAVRPDHCPLWSTWRT